MAQKQLVSSKAALTASVSDHLDRLYKRLSIQNDVLLSSQNQEEEQHLGELILAYLHEIPRGADRWVVNDYLTGEDRALKLDPTQTPQENAQRYFKRSARKKAAAKAAQAQKGEIEPQVAYLQSVLLSIDTAGTSTELGEIRAVSYTHLDVYKRQHYDSKHPASRPILLRRGTGRRGGRRRASGAAVAVILLLAFLITLIFFPG